MPKVSDPAGAGFEFTAPIRSLRLSVGEPVRFDFERQQLMLDRAPTTDAHLTPIDEVAIADGTVSFRAAGKAYVVRSSHPFDQALFACMAALQADGCQYGEPTDSVTIDRDGELVTRITLRRPPAPDSARETLTVVRSGAHLMRVIPVEATIVRVTDLLVAGNRVVCRTAPEVYEWTPTEGYRPTNRTTDVDRYEFALRLPEPILGTAVRLIELAATGHPRPP